MSLYAGKSDGTVAIVAGASGLEAESAMKQKGFVLASQPLNPLEGDLWINSNTLPTTFPVSGVKKYSNNQWINFGSYSPQRFDLWIFYSSETGYVNYYWDSSSNSWISFGRRRRTGCKIFISKCNMDWDTSRV